jgi:DNA-binding LacI/PurR family transcriptional regulator
MANTQQAPRGPERLLLCARALASQDTVRRAYAGEGISANMLERVRRAAMELGLEPPRKEPAENGR